jgi:Predicted transcriptional regulator
VASGQPNIRQKDIAKKLDITPQAVSEYIKEMVKERTIFSPRKGRYYITKEGIEYITKNVNELKNYATFILDDVIRIIDVSTAIADGEIKKGDLVGLYLKKGILYAHSGAKSSNRGAIGESVYDVLDGEDVGVKDIKGFIEMEEKEVKIIKIPNIKDGGSRRVNYPRAKNFNGCGFHLCSWFRGVYSIKKVKSQDGFLFWRGGSGERCRKARHEFCYSLPR